MSIVILEWQTDYALIDCPSNISNNINEYQQQFDKWLGNKKNEHDYWVAYEPEENFTRLGKTDPYEGIRDPEGKDGVSYGAEAFTNWLNCFVISEQCTEKAKVIWHDRKSDYSDNGYMKLEFDYPRIRF